MLKKNKKQAFVVNVDAAFPFEDPEAALKFKKHLSNYETSNGYISFLDVDEKLIPCSVLYADYLSSHLERLSVFNPVDLLLEGEKNEK